MGICVLEKFKKKFLLFFLSFAKAAQIYYLTCHRKSMKNSFKQIAIEYGVSILFLALFLVEKALNINVFPLEKWYILAYFISIQYLGKLLIPTSTSQEFIQNFIILIGLRFISAAIFIGVALYMGLQDRKSFILTFFVFYLCYTLFDFFRLSRNLRRF